MHHFIIETDIDAPIIAVFDLARDIDFHIRSMADSNEKAVAGVTSGLIEVGQSVTWEARHFGIPFRMTSEITEMDIPNSFVDAQSSGPFTSFRHLHLFEATATGTRMTDDITFTSPVGPIGVLVDKIFLGGYMERLITMRNDLLKTEAEARNA